MRLQIIAAGWNRRSKREKPCGARRLFTAVLIIAELATASRPVSAVEPPQDDLSAGYNYYTGGGITVQGPAVIVRKEILNRASVKAGYRVDSVSSASVDVVTQASPYKETRQEYSVGTDILSGDILMGLDYTGSRESDYTSDTIAVGLAQDIFDKNTTLNFRVARSWDQVGKNNDPAFGWKDFNRTIYATGITQSLTPRWLVQFNYEATADDGFINNPYRSAITTDGGLVPENYPDARTGHAWVVRTSYGFPSALLKGGLGEMLGSVQLDYRYYQDTFDVSSNTGKINFQFYLLRDWLFGVFYQYYQQGAASFYGDRLPTDQLYKARDKELSQYQDSWVGVMFKFMPKEARWGSVTNPFVQLNTSMMISHYDNFTDPRNGDLYSQTAYVTQTSFGFHF
jgi:Protein of unknown function (DUF3570)